MPHKKLLATLLATALLLSLALPASAAPAPEETESPSIVSVLISWLGTAFGLEVGAEPAAKLGIFVDPDGLEGSSEPDDDSSPTILTTTSDEEPGDELGIAIDPDG